MRVLPATARIVPPLNEEEQRLFEEAKGLLTTVEKRTTALVRAAAERWRPAQSVYDTDETSALVFSDEEYADFLTLVETLAENEMVRSVAAFVGLPQSMMDTIVQDKIKARLLPQVHRKGIPFVVRSGSRPQE